MPSYYAPTIESKMCIPCPPGTSCETEGLYEADICPPGTYRGTLEINGAPCVSCPQGTWSKNWHLREKGECVRCPTGVVCGKDGMTDPCSRHDLPSPYEPVVNLDGVPELEYFFSESDKPPMFSIDQCLALNSIERDDDNYQQEFFFGELIPPYIDILGRGAHFRPTDNISLKYSTTAKCFKNLNPKGSPLFQRFADYHGPQSDIQTGFPHQGYGTNQRNDPLFKMSIPEERYDSLTKYFYNSGMTFIDLPHQRRFSSAYNCTPGFKLLNSTLILQDERKVVYTDSNHDYEGGYDLNICQKSEFLEGKCMIEPFNERAIYMADDQFYPGTCEADHICLNGRGESDASICQKGYICDEATPSNESNIFPCPIGYICDYGTTPDPSLDAPNSQFSHICPNGFFCNELASITDGIICDENYFCPTGTADPLYGTLADDGLLRGLNRGKAFPFSNVTHLRFFGGDQFSLMSETDASCLDGNDKSLADRYKLHKIEPDPIHDPSNIETRNRTIFHNLESSQSLVIREATHLRQSCARDNKWKHINSAIRRNECNCNRQILIIAAVYRLWKCTANRPLENLGLGAIHNLGDETSGRRDFWFNRIHHDMDLALKMDKKMEGYGLKWGSGKRCEWPESKDSISLLEGKIPYEGENIFDGIGGRNVDPVPGKGIPIESKGFLKMTNYGTVEEPDVKFPIQFTTKDKVMQISVRFTKFL